MKLIILKIYKKIFVLALIVPAVWRFTKNIIARQTKKSTIISWSEPNNHRPGFVFCRRLSKKDNFLQLVFVGSIATGPGHKFLA